MDVVAGPQSLFVVVSQCGYAPYPTSIVRLETPIPNHGHEQVFTTTFSAHIPDLPLFKPGDIWWGISLPPASSTEDLYMLPDLYSPTYKHVGSFLGFIFNLSTKQCKLIKPPLAPKYLGYVVTMGDHIYFMTQTEHFAPNPHFERYDTLSQSWEELKPLPPEPLRRPFNGAFYDPAYIRGTAVLDDTIVFNMNYGTIWAYNVGKKEWYNVKVLDNICHSIIGEAVVLNKSIYVLVLGSELVVTLTLECQETKGNLVYTCKRNKEYMVPGMYDLEFGRWDSFWEKRLVHLGKDNFCLVQSCSLKDVVENQYIRIAYIEASEKKWIVTNICLHEFKLPDHGPLTIRHCFSMPNCKATELKEGTNLEHEAEIVTLPPELLTQSLDKYSSREKIIAEFKLDFQLAASVERSSLSRDHAVDTTPEIQEDVPKKSVVAVKSNVPSKASTILAESSSYAKPSSATKASTLGDGAASGRSNTDEEGAEGNVICVRNLPLDLTFGQLDKKLKKFGPIKRFKIHDMSECWVLDVEFESAISKQNAIKASQITIGGHTVVIEDRNFLTQGDSNRTSSSSSSGSNKIKNHDEVFRSKTTSGGDTISKKSHERKSSKAVWK